MSSDRNEPAWAMSASMPRIDVYIAAIGRSGSTALANMMTILPEQNVIVEPTAHAFGFNKWSLRENSENQRKLLETCMSLSESAARIGIKEVHPRSHLEILDLLQPRIIVVLVRNIMDVYLSYLEKHSRQGASEYFSDEWIDNYCVNASKTLVDLKKAYANSITLRYEDFFWDEELRNQFSQDSGWRLAGDPFKDFEAYNRLYEVSRNSVPRSPHITAATRNISREELISSERTIENCESYQRYFGYI